MFDVKPHLKKIYRINPNANTRQGFLRLDMNEGVPGLPKEFVREILSEIDSEFLATYPEYSILQERIAAHNNLRAENICLANGSDAAIKYIFDSYVSAGDRILLTDPTFAMYPVYCDIFDATPIIIKYDSKLSFPADQFMSSITEDIKIAVLVNPNNPTGSVINHGNLLKIIEKTAENGVLLIIDEAYFYFYPETMIAQVNNYKHLIVLRTFSKLCGLAAARLGYVASNPEIVKNLGKVKPTFDVNGLGVRLVEKLLDRPDIIDNAIKSVIDGREYLGQRLSNVGIEFSSGSANFILIKCRDRVDEIVKKLKSQNILIHGGFSQDFLKDYVRVTIGDISTMERFWNSFINIWESQ